ncbi:MAG TPA: hypothetical protein VFK20_14515 [Vicinamibacterales bacterium]|nr:hypothetical protein [Vicinamibacterales bacterium]
MLSIFSVALATALGTSALPPQASPDALLHAPTRHVRAADGAVHHLLARGITRSKTFAALVARLDASDVIVYVERTLSLQSAIEGRLLLLPTGRQRYLRVQVRSLGQPDDLVALIAHELRHAVEIADAPAVHDEASLVGLYEKIGHCVRPAHQYDTEEANHAERQVRSELALN